MAHTVRLIMAPASRLLISQASPQLRTPSHRYDSFKAPWQRPLFNATREVMLKLRIVGLFRHALVVDAWHLTAVPGAPSAWDGAHREVMLQTLIWTLVRFAYGRLAPLAGGGATPRRYRGGAGRAFARGRDTCGTHSECVASFFAYLRMRPGRMT